MIGEVERKRQRRSGLEKREERKRRIMAAFDRFLFFFSFFLILEDAFFLWIHLYW